MAPVDRHDLDVSNLSQEAGGPVCLTHHFISSGAGRPPNELTSTHHKGPFGGTPWHRRGDSCRYGSGSQVAARPAFGDSGKGLGDALLRHAEPAGDLGLRAATASQRYTQLVALHGAQAI